MTRRTGIPRIEPESGAVVLAGATFGPRTTRKIFLATPLGRGAEPLVAHQPWWSYRFSVPYRTGRFAIGLHFEDERLNEIVLTYGEAKFGTSSDDWTEAREKARKRWHDRWLRQSCGFARVRSFDWGRVESAYEARSGGSRIRLTY